MRKSFFIPVVILIVGITLFVFFGLDNLVRNLAIASAEKAFKSQVTIESASLTFRPFGFSFNKVLVADPINPHLNKVDIQNITAEIRLTPLLQKKIIIENLSLLGFKTNTSRPIPLKKENAPKTESVQTPETKQESNLPEINLTAMASKINVANLVNNAPLKLTKKSVSIKNSFQNSQEKWQKKSAEFEKNKTAHSLQVKVDDILQTNLASLGSIDTIKKKIHSIDNVKKEIKLLKSEFSAVSNDIQKEFKTISRQIGSLKKAANQDYHHLSSQLKTESLSVSGISQLLFGESISTKIITLAQTMSSIRDKLPKFLKSEKPQKISRIKGVDIHFKNTSSTPRFWIKLLSLSGHYGSKTYSGKLTHLSSANKIIKKPTIITYEVTDHSKPELNAQIELSVENELKIKIRKLDPLKNITLFSKGSESIHLTTGKINSQFDLTLVNDQLYGKLKLTGNYLNFKHVGIDLDKLSLSSIMAKTLYNMDELSLKGTIRGSLTTPNISVSSSIDSKMQTYIQSILQNNLKNARQELKDLLSHSLQEQTQEINHLVNRGQKQLTVPLTSLNTKFSQYENALNDKKKEWKNKVETLVKDEEERIRKQVEAEVKKKLETEKEKIKLQAEKLLKNLF